jgi:hypothetical protein
MFGRALGVIRRQLVAFVALFFALGGTALAANDFITAKETIPAGDLAGSTYGDPLIAAGKVTNAKLQNPSLSITAGTGLTGGGTVALGSSATIGVDPSVVQDRVTGTCPSGSAISSVGQSGAVGCQPADVALMMGGSAGDINAGLGGVSQFLAPVGFTQPANTLNDVFEGTSALPSTAGNLWATMYAPPGAGNTWTFTLDVGFGGPGTLSCAICRALLQHIHTLTSA